MTIVIELLFLFAFYFFFFFKQKTAYEMRISDWSSDVCSSDLSAPGLRLRAKAAFRSRTDFGPFTFRQRIASYSAATKISPGGEGREKWPLEGASIPNRGWRHAGDGGACAFWCASGPSPQRSEEHTSELQSLMRTTYAVLCLKK